MFTLKISEFRILRKYFNTVNFLRQNLSLTGKIMFTSKGRVSVVPNQAAIVIAFIFIYPNGSWKWSYR